MRESLAAIGVRGCCFAALLLMQRAFKPRRTAVDPRNALRVADEQSFGRCVGFLLRLRRLAARVCGEADRCDFWLCGGAVKPRLYPFCPSGGPLFARNVVYIANSPSVRVAPRAFLLNLAKNILLLRLTTTAGPGEQARLLRSSQSDHT